MRPRDLTDTLSIVTFRVVEPSDFLGLTGLSLGPTRLLTNSSFTLGQRPGHDFGDQQTISKHEDWLRKLLSRKNNGSRRIALPWSFIQPTLCDSSKIKQGFGLTPCSPKMCFNHALKVAKGKDIQVYA